MLTIIYLLISLILPLNGQTAHAGQPLHTHHAQPAQLQPASAETAAMKPEPLAHTAKNSNQHDDIVKYVKSYIENMNNDDKLVEYQKNIWIKKSNIDGVKYEGQTYYYSLFPHMSYDPVCRGELKLEDVEIVEEDRDNGFIIYKKRHTELKGLEAR